MYWYCKWKLLNDVQMILVTFSLPLTSFPMIEPGFQSWLREPFPLQPRHFHCSPGISNAAQELFHHSPGAFPLQPRNQASKTKCQHSSSLISSIKKRNFVIFERVPMAQPGFEPGTPRIKDKCLFTRCTQASLKLEVHLVIQIVNAAIALRLQCVHQGYNSIG